ncbi:hypothetical protein B0H63DRAFT_530140 [Podospora didyma]|uniref:Amine oxidase domain-containing protein n=1 Tax=Podospora didyma TaxID=330526 RepID=A0AAE0P3F9_9PEZI|nr:hypothetical protein B0H63DRAFT_530140 [Podospora didyma]
MVLDHLNEKYNLNARRELGGRLHSHYFKNKKGQPPVGDYDYYDVGAMRFPDIKLMDRFGTLAPLSNIISILIYRTFSLFKEVGMEKAPDHKVRPPKKGELIPYFLDGSNTPALYNGIQKVPQPPRSNPDGPKEDLSAANFKIPAPLEISNIGAGTLLDSQTEHYKEIYYSGPNGAKLFRRMLMREADSLSGILLRHHRVPRNAADGESLVRPGAERDDHRYFGFDATANWFSVEGGSQQLALNMRKHIKQDNVEFRKAVRAMSYVAAKDGEILGSANLKDGTNGKEPKVPDADVMITYGASRLNLSWPVKRAIRNLDYGASCKVGIRFKSLWRITKFGITQGGQGKTDLTIRFCVYPPHNVHDDPTKPGVLLASYTWSQEADHIGALINRESPEYEDHLCELPLHDLAWLHTNSDQNFASLREFLNEQ